MEKLSIVFPVYNQEPNLPKLFSASETYLQSEERFFVEILFVDDGSTDASLSHIKLFELRHTDTVRVISYMPNKGRGQAVRTGVLASTGDWIVVMDPDLAANFTEIEKILEAIPNGHDVLVGSRRVPGSVEVIPPSMMRSVLGMAYIGLARTITGVSVSDFSCGFKAYSKDAVQRIFPDTYIKRWSHDAEILYLAKKYGLSTVEIPLRWENGRYTSVRILRDSIYSFFGLLKMRYLHK